MHRSFLPLVLLTAGALLGPACNSVARAQVPRERNIWGGLDHEPAPSQVRRDEEATGITPSPRHERATTDEVESLYRSLMRAEPKSER